MNTSTTTTTTITTTSTRIVERQRRQQEQRKSTTRGDRIHHLILIMFLIVQVVLFVAGHVLIVVSGFGYSLSSSSPPVLSKYHHLHKLLFSRSRTASTVPAVNARTNELEYDVGDVAGAAVDHHHEYFDHHPYYGQVLDWLKAEQQQHEMISYRVLHELPCPFDQLLPLSSSKTSKHIHSFVELLQHQVGNNSNGTASIPRRSTLLHLIPTPSSLEDSLPPQYNQRFTDLVSMASTTSSPPPSPPPPRWNKVIHLHQDVWHNKKSIVQKRLSGQLGIYQRRIYARKTNVVKINATYATQFLDTNHLWGSTKAKHYYGLFYQNTSNKHCTAEDELVAVATFSNKRKVKRRRRPAQGIGIDDDTYTIFKSYELLRFCTQVDMTIVGGLSKLINKFIVDYRPDDIVTVIDRDWGNGHGWYSLNFTSVSTMPPLMMMMLGNNGSGVVHDQNGSQANTPPSRRRHLVGAGIEIPGRSSDSDNVASAAGDGSSVVSSRMGLPLSILTELESFYLNHSSTFTTTTTTTSAEAEACLDTLATKYNYYPVYDTGVERLFKVIPNNNTSKLLQHKQKSTSTTTSTTTTSSSQLTPTEILWKQSKPTFTNRYYSNYTFITSLLQYAAAGGTTQSQKPMDADGEKLIQMSWKDTQGTAKTAPIIFSTSSSLADSDTSESSGGGDDVIVEVRQRSHGWRTVGTVEDSKSGSNGKQRSIYHGVYKVNTTASKDGIDNGNSYAVVQPRAVIAEFIKTMASLVLTGIEMALDRNKSSSSDAANNMTDAAMPLRILYYGYGAGVLTRLLADCVTDGEHVAVELDRGVVEAAKIVNLPDNVELVVGDALEYTMQYNPNVDKSCFDCVCIDVFDNTLQVPKEFYSIEFLQQLCDNVLGPNGIIVHNFHSGGNKRNTQLEQVDKVYRSVFERRNCHHNHDDDIHCCWIDSLDSKAHAGNAILIATKFSLAAVGGQNEDLVEREVGADNIDDGRKHRRDELDDTLRNDLRKYGLISQYKYGLGFDIPARVVQFR